MAHKKTAFIAGFISACLGVIVFEKHALGYQKWFRKRFNNFLSSPKEPKASEKAFVGVCLVLNYLSKLFTKGGGHNA